jgi:demethylmenaquinone methyltransferase/2-methoxy-6-polyprenyl-1,4-benzoquinol methylase
VSEPSRSAPKVQAMFAAIAGRYDLANHLLSGGLDWFWRRRVARIVRQWQPSRILDLATGSGDLALALRAACPDASVVGADFCEAMLAEARRKGLQEVVLADALQLPFADGTFDVVTVAFGLRNMESWPRALAEMSRVLRPGGHCLILDFSIPSPPLRWLYRPYLRLVLPRLAALLTGQRDAYEYLGASIERFPSGLAMCGLLESAGFCAPQAGTLSGGIVSIYTAARAAD